MKKVTTKIRNQKLRSTRTRAQLNKGLQKHPRLSVFKSNRHIFLQVIDDTVGKTIVAAHDSEIKSSGKKRMEIAFMLGETIAKKAIDQKITKIVFDRGRDSYHGIVKSVADGARSGGLIF